MKKSAIKTISVLLAVLMLLSCGLVSAFAVEANYSVLFSKGETVGLENYACVVTGYMGTLGDEGLLHLPNVVQVGYFTSYFEEVGEEAFCYSDGNDVAKLYSDEIKEVVIESEFKVINAAAFANLANLEKVTIEGDIEIAEGAFENCKKLKTVILKGKKVAIGDRAFAGCAVLDDIRFETDVDLTTGTDAFAGTKWFDQYPTDFVIAGTTLVAYIGNDADVTIPLVVTKIGNGAFMGNQTIETVRFTKNIVALGDKAFMNCSALSDVRYSEYGDLTDIGVDVFTGTPFYNDYEGDFFCIEDRLIKYLGSDIYVEIPNTVREVASEAFWGCYNKSDENTVGYQISSIRVPYSVEICEEDCFTLYTKADGTDVVPVLYVYAGTEAENLVNEQGYFNVVLGKPGDVDVDKKVTAADARMALRFSVNLENATPEELYMADVDGDLRITASDARTILRIAVGLEEIDEDQLLTKPSTPTEIIQYYTASLDRAEKLQAGYTKKVSGSYAKRGLSGNSEISIDLNTYGYVKPLAQADASVQNFSRAYESNTAAAAANLVDCTLANTKAIETASCTIKDGKYYISIIMKTEEDIDSDTSVSDIYPVAGRAYYDSLLAGTSWFGKKNNWLTYDLYYKNCTVNAVIDIKTQEIESLNMGVTYFFDEIDGKINLVDVANAGRTSGTAHATRYDAISFSNFVY